MWIHIPAYAGMTVLRMLDSQSERGMVAPLQGLEPWLAV